MLRYTILLFCVVISTSFGYDGHLAKLLRRRFMVNQISFTKCPNGFVRHDDSCYIVAHDIADWPTALQYCEAYGAHLAFIESEREQTFVANHVKSILSSTTSDRYFWIGGTDAVSEGEWVWALIVQPVIEYTNWSPGNPNDANGGKHQDCMAMYGATGQWDDGWCETEHNFICEIDLDINSVPAVIG
ncbi:Collectin sub- member 10 (C-type lectin) [Mactra antiquata]